MHVVDRMLLKSANAKSEENKDSNTLNRNSSNLLLPRSPVPRPEKQLMNLLLAPVLNKTNNVIKEYTDDEKNKLEKVIFALKSENKNAENRNAEQERRVNGNLRDYDDLKAKYQALERENYAMRQENEELKNDLQKERNVIKDLLLGEQEDKLEIIRKNNMNGYEKKNEDLKKENQKILEDKYKLENSLLVLTKNYEEINGKMNVLNEENMGLKKQINSLNEYINKKERQIKTLIEEINREKKDGIAENFIDKTEKLKVVEEELKKQDEELNLLRKNLQEKIIALQETKANLEKNIKENIWQKSEIEQLNDKVSNLEKILEIKEEGLKNMEDLQMNYVKCKQNLADIVNLVWEKDFHSLLEEIDKVLTI